MTPEEARRLVLFSLIAVGTIASVDSFGKGTAPAPREVLGAGIVFLVLGGLADVAPGIAGPFAILVALTVTLSRGGSAFATLNRRLK